MKNIPLSDIREFTAFWDVRFQPPSCSSQLYSTVPKKVLVSSTSTEARLDRFEKRGMQKEISPASDQHWIMDQEEIGAKEEIRLCINKDNIQREEAPRRQLKREWTSRAKELEDKDKDPRKAFALLRQYR
ncbi:hypothetical protein RB195_025370 [Necator americanus]|uniref:Uncharacterized protein n=1 Tax=Necator americanus TaxID=51031 RepID=A0ABR1EU92_NECAM